ncbi:HAD-like superfamily [Sesbania bispinosa]|nr:HAD-like superfamily [Sesbania bispinosa]
MEATTSNKKHKKLTVDAVQPREVQKYCGVKLHWKVREKLQGSSFEYMFDLAHKVNTCKPLLVALTRTYQPQSRLFLFGEQQELELFFGLQDIFRITGLPIDGEPVSIEDVKLKEGEFASLTGLECNQSVISLQTLVDAINMSYDDVNNMDEKKLNQICRIVALLGIGCMIMQETKSTIKIKYICLLRKVEAIKDYAWGAATWASLHSSLIQIKNGDGMNLYGSVISLMIPRIIPYVYKDRVPQSLDNLSFPMMIEFTNIIGRDEMVNNYNQTQTSEFEAVPMTLTGNDIKWTYGDLPPTSHNNYYDQEQLGYSVTTAIADSFIVKHQPHLAPRQFPLFNPRNKFINQWVKELPTINVGRKNKKGSLDVHKKLWEQRWSRLISFRDEDNQDSPNPSQRGAKVQVMKKKLLVLDINGLLAHIVYANHGEYHRHPDAIRGKNAIFMRPFVTEFLEFCFDKFDVGIWSSRMMWNLHSIIDAIMGNLQNKLVFCWDGSHYTHTNHYSLHGNKQKKTVFKELKKIWEDSNSDLPWEKGTYNESNTLLLDDSPYKGLCNPPFTSVFPHTFTSSDENDFSLADGGDLRSFLEGLAHAEDMRNYIQEKAFGQPPITETSQEWHYYKKVLTSISKGQV